MSVVLIADDEEALLDVLSDAVGAMGHQVVRALDGEDALSLARAQPPDVLLTDLMMPRRTGAELIAALRTDPALARIPIILMTALRTGSFGADRCLEKPITVGRLAATLDELLGTKGEASPKPQTPERSPLAQAHVGEQLLRWAAHELKTPLSAAQMTAHMLLVEDADRLPPKALSRIRIIARQVERMTQIVNEVLDAGQLADGRVQLRKEPGDLAAYVKNLVADWHALHPDFTFALELPTEPAIIPFDGQRLRLVLDNLVSNACKYGAPPKVVEVRVELTPALAHIRVTDHGPGIPASEQKRIFEQFERGEAPIPSGHGLGLYIAGRLTRLHRGSLRVQSELGKGATFCVSLPRV